MGYTTNVKKGEITMEWTQVKGYDQLDEDQIQRLSLVYARHMEELDDPSKYKIENIENIKRNQENYSVTLTFTNGETIHYTPEGEWY